MTVIGHSLVLRHGTGRCADEDWAGTWTLSGKACSRGICSLAFGLLIRNVWGVQSGLLKYLQPCQRFECSSLASYQWRNRLWETSYLGWSLSHLLHLLGHPSHRVRWRKGFLYEGHDILPGRHANLIRKLVANPSYYRRARPFRVSLYTHQAKDWNPSIVIIVSPLNSLPDVDNSRCLLRSTHVCFRTPTFIVIIIIIPISGSFWENWSGAATEASTGASGDVLEAPGLCCHLRRHSTATLSHNARLSRKLRKNWLSAHPMPIISDFVVFECTVILTITLVKDPLASCSLREGTLKLSSKITCPVQDELGWLVLSLSESR